MHTICPNRMQGRFKVILCCLQSKKPFLITCHTHKKKNKYTASIKIKDVKCFFGDFNLEKDAALRYNIAYKLADNYTKENAKKIRNDVEYIIKNNISDYLLNKRQNKVKNNNVNG